MKVLKFCAEMLKENKGALLGSVFILIAFVVLPDFLDSLEYMYMHWVMLTNSV